MEKKDFGLTDYRRDTTRYKQAIRRVHKRTSDDETERNTNPNFKSLKILKSEYGGDWPFYADEVIIECRDIHWCVITINGYDYGLNGSAKDRYNLDGPHEAGMAVIGKDISEFKALASKL